MKTSKYLFHVMLFPLLLTISLISGIGCTEKDKPVNTAIIDFLLTPTLKATIDSLVADGYSYKWARNKALVEANVIPVNDEYLSIIED